MEDLRPQVKTAAQALGQALKDTPALRAYAEASAQLSADNAATGLLDELQRLQADIRQRQSDGHVGPGDIMRLRRLQNDVQANETIAAFVQAQSQAQGFLRQVNTDLSERLGVDFATLGRVSTCC